MRWIFRIVSALVMVALVLVAAVFLLPKDRIAGIALDQVRAQTGREVTLSGDLAVSLWPVLGVTTGPVTFANADWAGPEPMLTASALSIGVDTSALWGGAVQVRHIEMTDPVVRLATRADGTGNWEFGTAGAPAAPAPAPGAEATRISLEKLTLRNARVVYAAAGAAPLELRGIDLDLDWPDVSGPARIDGRFGLGGGAPITVAAEIAQFSRFIEGQVVPLTVRVDADGGRLDFAGRASTAAEAQGRVTLAASDTGRFLGVLGLSGVALPANLGKTVDFAADATLTRDMRLSLRDMSATTGVNRVSGAVDVVLSEVPQVTAQLAAGALDLSAVAGGDAGAAPQPAAGAGWSRDLIDASALAALNGNISLDAASIDLGDVQLGPSRLAVAIDRSRAVLKLVEVSVFDGKVTGELVANNRNGLSVGGDLKASAIEMQRLLGDMAGTERLSGKAQANLKFLGVGNSMDAIMRSLSGGGALEVGRGVISGIDLDRLMRSGDGTGGTTVFDALTASFAIDGGNLRNDDLLLLLSNFKADGAGRLGLGAQDVDYLFTPVALRANSGQGVALPVRIRGPWSALRIQPDLSEAIKLNADGKIEEVKAEARAKAEEKLKQELNIAPVEGQSIEDAVKDKLEDKAKEGLLKLLNRN